MEQPLVENKTLTPDLQDLLKHIKDDIDTSLQHSRRLMLADMITHINRLTRDTYYKNKDIYAKLMVFLNTAMKKGKVYLDELKFA